MSTSVLAAREPQANDPARVKKLTKKRERPEVTADMLLGPNGFTKLAEDMTKLVCGWSQGAGNEVLFFPLFMTVLNIFLQHANLHSFLTVYSNWHKQLLPALSFDEFLKKTEALASHANIRVSTNTHFPFCPNLSLDIHLTQFANRKRLIK